ncbi:bifunctional hydroxymethylpyrimidine kinase/phosphomethylpyrimidine kinase [Kordiimonas pumila]|uniref:hydroxymethylpyrimidine kinase n=1 Tax=Kordiimonas pumila TaxID=2161677 RepID=A0ABV7D853_9PROT|nr:bifunctional hydroxymethylpyrimidine kinase/phosphomethylpyrimidine kinase [Kordiimonas pumila]
MTEAALTRGRVLVVAGSDPSGGAGIQADIKTISALRGYAATAITALTVQNTLGVTDVMPVPSSFIASQIKAVLSDIGADCVKTGMLHSAEVVETVVSILSEANFRGAVVVDPVMVATSGDRLLEVTAVESLKKLLIPRATVLTPNIPEAELLTGTVIKSVDDMRRAAGFIIKMGAESVLMKGGHLDTETIHDVLIMADGTEYICAAQKRHTRHTHGTGCTLASALATGLALGQALPDAFRHAHAFVQAAIEAAPGFGAGCGPLGHSYVRVP